MKRKHRISTMDYHLSSIVRRLRHGPQQKRVITLHRAPQEVRDVEYSTVLYHYTSRDTFIKIIENIELWATHIRYLNDAAEFEHAVNMLEEALTHRPRVNLDQRERLFLDSLLQCVKQAERDIYVLCFSTKYDSLSQWRGYSTNGPGYAVAFKAKDLWDPFIRQEFHLCKCIYNQQTQLQKINSLIDAELAKVHDNSDSDDSDIAQVYAQRFADEFQLLAPQFKHWSFEDEAEYRLISSHITLDNPRLEFRKGTSMITPYFRFNLETEGLPLPLAEVLIGPTPHPELAMKATRMLLRKHGLSEDLVKESTIPFRTW
jgi:hypothetical protein